MNNQFEKINLGGHHDIIIIVIVKIYNHEVATTIPSSMEIIDVIIALDQNNPDNLNAFFCPYDRNPQPLLQYQGKIISITPGHAPLRLPIIKRCGNCKRNYSFNSIV